MGSSRNKDRKSKLASSRTACRNFPFKRTSSAKTGSTFRESAVTCGSFNVLLSASLVTMLAVMAGCENSTKQTSGSDHAASGASAPESRNDALSEAREKLNTSLDSWTFGDSKSKFESTHPDIRFNDLPDILRESQLMRYEVTNNRPKTFSYDDGTTYPGFEFSVVMTFAAKNGQEFKESRIYGVHKKDGKWSVFGDKP